MRGLLLKDFYIIRSLVILLLVVYLVIGISLSYLATPWVLVVLATAMLGMIISSTINVDKSCGWIRTVAITPSGRQTYIDGKYLLYLLLSTAGLVFGVVFGAAATLFAGSAVEEAYLYLWISAVLALIAGSILLPCHFLLDEMKSTIGTIAAYPAAAGFFVLFVLLLGPSPLACAVTLILSVCAFGGSWQATKKILERKDL